MPSLPQQPLSPLSGGTATQSPAVLIKSQSIQREPGARPEPHKCITYRQSQNVEPQQTEQLHWAGAGVLNKGKAGAPPAPIPKTAKNKEDVNQQETHQTEFLPPNADTKSEPPPQQRRGALVPASLGCPFVQVHGHWEEGADLGLGSPAGCREPDTSFRSAHSFRRPNSVCTSLLPKTTQS